MDSHTKPPITLHPIGFVQSAYTEPISSDILRSQESRIVLDPDLTPGLDGLENGQAIWILFHFHRNQDFALHQHPRGDRSRPKQGVFSLRSPKRPNRIGLTQVELIRIEGNILYVRNLDAIDGSPVLDIKPV